MRFYKKIKIKQEALGFELLITSFKNVTTLN